MPRILQTPSRASSPAQHSRAYDPAATEPADVPLEGATLYVGTGGDVAVRALRDAEGVFTLFKNVADGTFLPVRIREIDPDDTTADDLVLIW
jgi:hypothetical protein